MIDQDEPLLCFLTIEELMRTAHVVGEVPFIKPRHGMLLNLTTVQWIIEAEYVADETELTTGEAVAALEDEDEVDPRYGQHSDGAGGWHQGSYDVCRLSHGVAEYTPQARARDRFKMGTSDHLPGSQQWWRASGEAEWWQRR
jgi:hypothetical protein